MSKSFHNMSMGGKSTRRNRSGCTFARKTINHRDGQRPFNEKTCIGRDRGPKVKRTATEGNPSFGGTTRLETHYGTCKQLEDEECSIKLEAEEQLLPESANRPLIKRTRQNPSFVQTNSLSMSNVF